MRFPHGAAPVWLFHIFSLFDTEHTAKHATEKFWTLDNDYLHNASSSFHVGQHRIRAQPVSTKAAAAKIKTNFVGQTIANNRPAPKAAKQPPVVFPRRFIQIPPRFAFGFVGCINSIFRYVEKVLEFILKFLRPSP